MNAECRELIKQEIIDFCLELMVSRLHLGTGIGVL